MNVNDLLQKTTDIASAYRGYHGGYFKTLLSPMQSGGELAILDMVLPKGAEPPPHIHEKEHETFYILEGTVEFVINGTAHVLVPGAALFAPRQAPHYFKILTATARIITIMTPGDLWHYFVEFSEPCNEIPQITSPEPPTPEQIRYMAERLSSRYHLNLLTK
ncbi:MAG: cupin domain-containing protein [Chitinophagaceae bacterium]|nr:cupin domain-containing protein [Chitinophagaceae bacterium]